MSSKSSNKLVKGTAKNETMKEKIEKAREKKEAAKERKGKSEVKQPQSSVSKVKRNEKDKKMANFLHQATVNREKQQVAKKALQARMQAKLVQIKEAKDKDSDDDEEEDEGDEIPDEGEEEEDEGDQDEEELAMQEFEGELASNQNDLAVEKAADTLDSSSDEGEGGGLTEVATMEDLKKKFSGKRVPSVEELKTEAEREARLDEIVRRREEQRKEFIAERQAQQAIRRHSKRRKLQGNQRTRVGPAYMPFLSKGF